MKHSFVNQSGKMKMARRNSNDLGNTRITQTSQIGIGFNFRQDTGNRVFQKTQLYFSEHFEITVGVCSAFILLLLISYIIFRKYKKKIILMTKEVHGSSSRTIRIQQKIERIEIEPRENDKKSYVVSSLHVSEILNDIEKRENAIFEKSANFTTV